jgi:hypothetical protein
MLEHLVGKHASIIIEFLLENTQDVIFLSQFNFSLAFVDYTLRNSFKFSYQFPNLVFSFLDSYKTFTFVSQCLRGTGRLAHLLTTQQCQQMSGKWQ